MWPAENIIQPMWPARHCWCPIPDLDIVYTNFRLQSTNNIVIDQRFLAFLKQLTISLLPQYFYKLVQI